MVNTEELVKIVKDNILKKIKENKKILNDYKFKSKGRYIIRSLSR